MLGRYIGANDGREMLVLGTRVRCILGAADTGGGITFVEIRLRPGDGILPHVHGRDAELFHVLDGEIRFRIGADDRVAGPGTTLYAPQGVPHSFRAGDSGDSRMLVWLTPGGLDLMFDELARLPADAPPDMDLVRGICRRYEVEFIDAA